MAQRNGTSGKPTKGAASPPPGEPERLPAYFLSLSLENVRCFGPKQTLDLSDGNGKPAPWTIILGLNGTGKTTILQLLVSLELVPTHSDDPPAMPRLMNWHPDVRPIWIRNGGKLSEWGATYTTSPRLKESPGRIARGSVEMVDEIRARCSFPRDHSPWCCAYGAGRRLGSVSLSESEFEDPTATLFLDAAPLRNPEEWLLQLDYAAAKAPKDKDQQHRLAQAKELLLNILPDIEDIRLTTTSGPKPKPRAEFKTPYGWVPLRQLGYGYQALITWIADLASRMAERYPESANPLAEPAVVLVDEIDLHLHPKWQRKLVGFLTERFPNTQFIATAHSPLVAQAAADANLAVLRREGDHVIIDNEVDNIRNWRIDQILTSDLFGLETARPPQVEALLAERDKLLDKSKRSAAEKRRLEELNNLVHELPFGETAQERKERNAIQQALDLLMKERKPAS